MIQLVTYESEYKGGFFPTIPSRVLGQDTLLIGSDGVPRLVDDYLTTRDIRKGNFNKIARVSTSLFTLDLVLKATSKNAPYKFDVTVGVDCRVSNSIVYYMGRSTHDLENSLSTALSRVVTPEAKKFELTDDNVNHSILHKLQEKEKYFLEILGITYTVVSVESKPDADAEGNFIKKMTDQKLNVMIEQNRLVETGKLTSRNLEEAIMGQVADGKIDMKTALEELIQANRREGYAKLEDINRLIDFVRKLQTDNFISDDEAGQRINELLQTLPANVPNGNLIGVKTPLIEEKTDERDTTLDELLPDEGDKQ